MYNTSILIDLLFAGTRQRVLAVLPRSEQGNQMRYQANRGCPLFDDLASLFRKTHGASMLLHEALAPLHT